MLLVPGPPARDAVGCCCLCHALRWSCLFCTRCLRRRGADGGLVVFTRYVAAVFNQLVLTVKDGTLQGMTSLSVTLA